MKLEGIHHITAITGDARQNVEFYVGVLGLRLVKKTVNQDDPTVYHLFYGDEQGDPGADLTFFEYPGAAQGRAGAGMVHRIGWRVGSGESLDFWESRLADEGVSTDRTDEGLVFSDPEGLEHILSVYSGNEPALTAKAPDIPDEHTLQGFDGVRVFAADPAASEGLLRQTLGFESSDGSNWSVGGDERSSYFTYDEPPAEHGIQGAGSVHHVAFATRPPEHDAWQERVRESGAVPTPVIDRFYFKSIYFREPSGVLFELATIGPGFAVDEPAEELGQHLSLPPKFEHLRENLAGVLTPLPDPHTERSQRVQ
ncbi:MAG TPA: VOC family protein [Solirubrobacterales bacterium]|jgi:glyoxalase family protein|nr:VOC family protein [Solirubrobacterales bacterium]